ncbi:MAG TPA: glycosyltransferase [Gaiellaceae bacterium]|nr:glycosyltransferase [Gaiellaceae bacterium]
MTATPRYAVVTPVKDEEEHLRVLAASLATQTVAPSRWIVVENGSSDRTLAVARDLAREFEWVRVVVTDPAAGIRGAPVVRAFHAGLEALDGPVEAVAKVDADVSLAPDYFERLLGALASDRSLGLLSGTCVDVYDGVPIERAVTGDQVWGAARMYRWECLQDVLPLEERMGWDGIDVVKAQALGWRTATLRELPFDHHRREGERDGSRWAAWLAQGVAARYMRYRPSYLLLKTAHRALREPQAVAILCGYGAAALRREPRCPDRAVVGRLREVQRLRSLPLRAREALGR